MTDLALSLDDVAAYTRRYVVLSEPQLTAVTLWIAHTHAIDAAEQSPYLSVTSAVKESGKSRVLEVCDFLAARPWKVIGPSEAVVFRKIDRDRVTLLLDEIDTIWNNSPGDNHEGLRAILNAGNRRGTRVPRCAGPQGAQLVEFNVFGPKALAGIGRLPETVAGRAIQIRLRKKTPTESVDRFRIREAREAAEPIAISLASIIEQLVPELTEARPELPDELSDRAQDGWEPLLAIADAAGGDWPARARTAAIELSAGVVEDDNMALRLLADVRRVFDASGADRLATAALIDGLAADEEAPWATWHRGERIGARGLSTLLRPFDVHPKAVRIGTSTPRGYLREAFEDAWLRYLQPAESAPSLSRLENLSATPETLASPNGLRGDTHPQQTLAVADPQRGANPHGYAEVVDVADKNPNQERGRVPAAGDRGFLDHVRAAFRAGHLTHGEYRERVAWHAAIRATPTTEVTP
jgi:hypothetical protein